MKLSSLLSSTARHDIWVLRASFLTSLFLSTQALTFNPIPSPDLDLSQLGRAGLAGDFDGISLYQYEGQNENGFSTNGSQSILARYPNGGFTTLASADAGIKTMCSFVMKDGTMAGIIVAGNFTSLGGVETQGVAMFNPNSSTVTPLPGLSGQVSALLCDKESNTVYVGGNFRGANSSNAIAWVGTAGWTNLPFNGFNGPVESISKASTGHIIFGGTFTGLGNATSPSTPDQQIINIADATITSGSSSSTIGFSDPQNIVCKTGGVDGVGSTWLISDETPGFWKAEFGFGFQPTKLRLYNSHLDGRGTKTWRYTALPINGIMNFTYVDPVTGNNSSCSSECPLSNDTNVIFQDFHFVNVIGMDTFRIDVSDWYGPGGGLNGIELFQDDIFAYAVQDFNEPTCMNIDTASKVTKTGPWTVSPSHQSVSKYLTAILNDTGSSPESASVVFLPDIKQSGNYTVNIYTPGCIQDNTCSSRGRVNVTGAMSSSGSDSIFQTEIFQSNNFDKYDQIYFGYIEAASSSFRPSVTLSPSSGQNTNLTIVAQRVGFTMTSSSGGLNSIFEYDSSQAIINTANFTTSVFDKAGSDLGTGAGVHALVTSGDKTFVAGNFSSTYDNIFAIDNNGAAPLPGGGLNSHVMTMFLNGSTLYVGGNFTDTTNSSTKGLSNIAAYDTSKDTWSPLGAGLNGRVFNIVPLLLNITDNTPETVITVTGNFNQILAFGNNASVAVSGLAIWVPSQSNWLQNLNVNTVSIKGQLTASVDIPNGGVSLFSGSLSSAQISANGVVTLSNTLSPFPVHIQSTTTQSQTSLQKRETINQNFSGVVTGLFYEADDRNVTVLGGHFNAKSTKGSSISNLIFINGSNSDTVTGVGPQLSNDSSILALALEGDNLFAGGLLSGIINGQAVGGLISYDLRTAALNSSQPPALKGDNVAVYTITNRPDSDDIYVGGNFKSAGSLDCPGICLFTTSTQQWNRPGTSLSGVVNTMAWTSDTSLIAGGSLAIGGSSTPLATYDSGPQTWSTFNGSNAIPGPVTALASASSDASQFWIAGVGKNGSAFLMKYDGKAWHSVGDVLGATTNIRGLKILPLSKNHDSTDLIPASEVLMLTGTLNLPDFGNASAVLFNGTMFQPFALTSSGTNGGGSLSQLFTQKQNIFKPTGKHLALGFVVLISLAIALALVFLMVIAGILVDKIRKRQQGYTPAPTNMFDRANLSRVPPEQMFGTLGQGRDASAPKI